MKKILGLDVGTNSIGWSLIQHDFENKEGDIEGLGVRIIPMSQDILGKFDSGQSYSQTADRTRYRSVRRLYQRNHLRRERLHRVLNILGFLPRHYADGIDYKDRPGHFKADTEVKVQYRKNRQGKHEFIFMDAFKEMINDFRKAQPRLFYTKKNGEQTKIPCDWTIYYLRKKALSKAISKEELAWIILNFNQKRGYYQLRGTKTEAESSEAKGKTFAVLVGDKAVENGDILKNGNKLYDLYFTNGWKYDKPIAKPELWIGREKEFIATTSIKKSGEIKRTFKSVDSEKDWEAIKAKTEMDIDRSGKTVGEYIYESLLNNPKQKIRGKFIKTIERKYYKDEFKRILSRQIELQPELFTKELYLACIRELYPRNEQHQKNIREQGFEYLFTEDIIFYQRPLKSQKHNISGCPYEYKSYMQKDEENGQMKSIKVPVKAIAKSHPLYEEFRLWQWLHNLKIYYKNDTGKLKDVTMELLPGETEWVDLFDYLNTKPEITQSSFIEYFVKRKLFDKGNKEYYRWNYVEDKNYPLAATRAKFISRLNKTAGVNNVEEFLDEKSQLGKEGNGPFVSRLEQLWHIVYSVTDFNEYQKALEKFAARHALDKASFVEHFIKLPAFESDYGSYSRKAIQKLLPLMRMGKYWDESVIPEAVKERAHAIMERVNSIQFSESDTDKEKENELDEELARVSDDDIPKHLIKSFLPFKGKNPLKGLNTYQATYLVYGRHSEAGDIQKWKSPEDIDNYLKNFKQHSLRNPIVEQIVTETLRVVRDIWKHYGNGVEGFFDEIHVELGREMKNPAARRQKISKINAENERTNYRIRELLKELKNNGNTEGDIRAYSPSQQELLKIYEEGISQNPNADYSQVTEDEILRIRKSSQPTQKEIQKYRLWLEQGYISPYTGKMIPLAKLFTHEYEIEHIIPQSRYFDNSLNNKVICESEINQDKGNQTAHEYIKEKGGSLVNGNHLLKWESYKPHVQKYFAKNRKKLEYLLNRDIPEGFINRQLNDSRYISKLVKGLLSNVVREEKEQEATSKHLIPVTGTITSTLKRDWGLTDKWNEIIAPRFERLNKLTHSEDFGFWDKTIHAFRNKVPDDIGRGFDTKRIDHRHHALDALVIACTTRNHTHYLSALNAENNNESFKKKLLRKNENGHFTQTFQMPWNGFATEAKNRLEKTVVSFKQNFRVINKTRNKFWSYKDENGKLNVDKTGKPVKKLRVQTKGDHWAIRKPLHKETVSGIYKIDTPKGKIATSVRTPLSGIKNEKHLARITDKRIREVILPNHLKNYMDANGTPKFDEAFSPDGIEELNRNMVTLNNGKPHQPIFNAKLYEVGNKFPLGTQGNKKKKYVEAAKGSNVFFVIYWDEKKQKRTFETVPLHEVIAHQKKVAHLTKAERPPIPPKPGKGTFLFTLSPNDLVYVPDDEEVANPDLVDFSNLDIKQMGRIYKFIDSSNIIANFIPSYVADIILNIKPSKQKELINKFKIKNEYGLGSPQSKSQKSIDNIMIKERCWKLEVDRLGNITGFKR